MSLLDAGRDANAGCAPRLCAPRSPIGSQRARLLCVAVLVVLTACADEAVATAPLTPRQLELQCAALAAEERSRCGADELAALPAICARLERGVTDAGPGGPAAAAFDLDYGACLDAAKHRQAMFSYRGHPGDPRMYRRVRVVRDGFKALSALRRDLESARARQVADPLSYPASHVE